MRRTETLAFGLALALLGWGVTSQAEEYMLHTWKKVPLQSKFFCEGAYAADFNRDGKMDVVSGPYWYEGPSFETKREIYPAEPFDKNTYSKNFLSFADDIDKDEWTDVIVIGFPGQESWWFRNPQGKEGPWERYVIDDFVGNESPAYLDVNGDGRGEVIYSNRKGQYGYATPDAADPKQKWVFTPIGPIANLHHFTHGMGLGDVNGDGRLDLLEKDGWWEQPPKGTAGFWKKHEVKFSGPGGAQMYAYDFDGDGDNDVVTSLQAHSYGLAWYEQMKGADGAIAFERHVVLNDKPVPNPYGIVFSQLHAVDLVDVDQDGVMDVVTGKRHWAHNGNDPDERGPAVLYWFRTVRSKEGVEFVPHLIDNDSGVGTQVLAKDITGDGWVDIVVGNKLGTFLHLHEVKKVSKEEWEKAQPKKTSAPEANGARPKEDRLSGFFPQGATGEPLNLGFEKGDLSDWKIVNGLAFSRQPVEGDAVARRRSDMASGHVGKYWLGTYEALGDLPQGVLASAPFVASAPFASFLLAGGSSPETRVELVDAKTNQVFFRATGLNVENLRPVLVDLQPVRGKEIFVRVVDKGSGGWGHVNFDDFRLHETKPVLVDELVPVKLDELAHAGLSAEEAARAMEVPSGFRVDVIAAEPELVQPIAMTIDERGRLWVAEAYEYPIRAREGKGRDRILIFADADGDGRFETRKVFAEGLNLVSGMEVGHGGVFIGAAPHLLFLADKDGDDKPDGEPVVLLDGWAYEDTHETLNSFIWGPDGWLYGCHGVFTHSKVGLPGTSREKRQPINAGIWRYHPTKKRFEVFAHGTSNPWGVDFNDEGQCFLTCCVIPHLFHVIQGARYQRQAGTHFNPHTYADIPTIAKHRHWVGPQPHAGNNVSDSAGGGHAHAGCMIYLGGSWPEKYHNQIFMNNIHGARLNQDVLMPAGSGYVGDRAPDLLLTHDRASQILYMRSGPDGQMYMIDWYDMNQCHLPDPVRHDRSNGRLFRVTRADAEPVKVNLRVMSDAELVELQRDKNDWMGRTARRLLAERAAERALEEPARLAIRALVKDGTERNRLRGIWTGFVTGLWGEEDYLRFLEDESPYLRGFAIQFALEEGKPSSTLVARLASLGRSDPSPIVRLYLASGAERLPTEGRVLLLDGLVSHAEDAKDHNLPLMYWYAAETLAAENGGMAFALAQRAKTPRMLEFMARRLTSEGPGGLEHVVAGLARTEEDGARLEILKGISAGLTGQRRVEPPTQWREVASKLAESANGLVVETTHALSAKFGDAEEMKLLRGRLADERVDLAERREALRALLEVRDPELAPVLLDVLKEKGLRGAVLRGLAFYKRPETPERVLAVYAELSLEEKRDALALLTTRAEYARELLEAIGAKKIPATDLTADGIRQLRSLGDASLDAMIAQHWGIARDVSADKKGAMERYRKLLASEPAEPVDVTLGRAVYARTCATCHELFGTGSDVGPGLTGSNRRDLEYVLSNVIDPSAVMAKEYQPHTVVTVDGRVLTGIVKSADEKQVTLRTANESVVLGRDEIDEMTLSPKSMMPEDQWEQLKEEEVRALVAYLASDRQVAMRATKETASLFFNGQNLAGWRGNEKLWSVENGEIVGRSPGLKRNEFLVSDLLASDFRLQLKVKLVPNGGNSGIQFRSAPIEHGEMKGYQADIGVGWWGKLYEENGRAILWDKSAESAVKLEEWNEYEVVARGEKIQTFINGVLAVDLVDPQGAREGVFALQIHAGPAMEVRFKDLVLEVEPELRSASRR